MQRPTLLEGMVVALVISLATSPLAVLLNFYVGGWLGVKALLAGIAYSYIVYLLARRGRTVGHTVLALLSALALLASLGLAAPWMVLLAMALIASIRAGVYSRSLFAGLLHGSLCLLGLGAAFWAYRESGSLLLAVWSFFLLQALFVYLPVRLGAASATPENSADEEHFARSYQAAQHALARLRTGSVR